MDQIESRAEKDLGDDLEELPDTKKAQRRMRSALAMKLAGARDDEIADILNYASPAAARAGWETAMASTFDPNTDLKALRQVAVMRLEAGMKALAPTALNANLIEERPDPNKPGEKMKVKVVNENLAAHSQVFLRYVDRLIRLQGLDAPQVVSLITPDVAELENFVATVLAQSGQKQLEEGDIFDAEIVEDDDAEVSA